MDWQKFQQALISNITDAVLKQLPRQAQDKQIPRRGASGGAPRVPPSVAKPSGQRSRVPGRQIPQGFTRDNLITNFLVDQGALPENQREIFPQQPRRGPNMPIPRQVIPRQPMAPQMPPPRAPIPPRQDVRVIPSGPILQSSSFRAPSGGNILGAATGVEDDIGSLQRRDEFMRRNLRPPTPTETEQQQKPDFLKFFRALFENAPWNR